MGSLFTIHYKKGPLFTNHYTPSRPFSMPQLQQKSSAEIVANIVDPDQTAPIGAVCSVWEQSDQGPRCLLLYLILQ